MAAFPNGNFRGYEYAGMGLVEILRFVEWVHFSWRLGRALFPWKVVGWFYEFVDDNEGLEMNNVWGILFELQGFWISIEREVGGVEVLLDRLFVILSRNEIIRFIAECNLLNKS